MLVFAVQQSESAMKVLVAQSDMTLSNPKDCSPQGSSVHGILQARLLEWVVIFYSRDLSDPGRQPGSPTLQQNESGIYIKQNLRYHKKL